MDALERKYDSKFKVIFDAIRKLMGAAIRALMKPPPGVAKRRIGFRPLPEGDR